MIKKTYKNSEVFSDPEYLNRFVKNVESAFRKRHPIYNYYKSHLINNVGINRCQLQSNISIDIADLEMHHVIITLYDEILTITKFFLRTKGYVNSFMVLKEIAECHRNNIIPIVMLTKSNHEKCHKSELFIPIELVYGDLYSFLDKYGQGITYPILYKILDYCNKNDKYLVKNIEIMNLIAGISEWYNKIGGDDIDSINIFGNSHNIY